MTISEKIEQLEMQIKDLEDKSLKYKIGIIEAENIKNNIFDSFIQVLYEPTKSATASYIKTTWKSKIIYIPYYV